MNWIIPSIIISLSNLLGFMLPSECGEKITLRKCTNINCKYIAKIENKCDDLL